MSRLKLWIGILAVMVLALGPVAVQASLVNYNATHTFAISIQRDSLGTYLPATSGNITTAVSGYGYYNPSETNGASAGPTAVVIGTGSSVGVNPAAGTWLLSSATQTSYDGATGGSIQHTFTGRGPDPNGNANGKIAQRNYYTDPEESTYTQLLHLVFTADMSGQNTYRVNFSDAYSLLFNMAQGSGSPFPFSKMTASSRIYVNITAPSGSSINYNDLFTYTAGNGSYIIPSYSYSTNTGSWSYGPADYLLNFGETITVDVSLTDYYNALTLNAVPLPSTMLLLGGGLAFLGLLGRRKLTHK